MEFWASLGYMRSCLTKKRRKEKKKKSIEDGACSRCVNTAAPLCGVTSSPDVGFQGLLGPKRVDDLSDPSTSTWCG